MKDSSEQQETLTPRVQAIVSVLESHDCSEIEGVICTNYALWARDVLGCGQVFGFFDQDNPGTETGQHAGGHDFLVIDDRWIVDLWVREVVGWSEKVVFDLEDETDSASVTRFFGDRQKWCLVSR